MTYSSDVRLVHNDIKRHLLSTVPKLSHMARFNKNKSKGTVNQRREHNVLNDKKFKQTNKQHLSYVNTLPGRSWPFWFVSPFQILRVGGSERSKKLTQSDVSVNFIVTLDGFKNKEPCFLKWYYDQKVTLPFLFIFRKYVL